MGDAPKDGGAAFPVIAEGGDTSGLQSWFESGMSLRDWFAGQALAGICAALGQEPNDPNFENPRVFARFGFDQAARDAYHIADAMLAERNKGAGE